MAVKTYSAARDGKTALSPHFKVREFACKDGSDTILIESGLVDILEKVYKHFTCSSIKITSGYRTASHDKKVGGKGSGNHVEGKAADFVAYDKSGCVIPSATIVLYLEDLDAQMSGAFGIGYRCGGSANATHIDVNYRTSLWYGDEKISMTKSIGSIKNGCTSFYDYLGVFTPFSVRVKCDTLNIRKSAGTQYEAVGQYVKGEVAAVSAVNANKTWGKTDKGWICLDAAYTEALG